MKQEANRPNSHLNIKDSTLTSCQGGGGLIFTYQQGSYHRINLIQQQAMCCMLMHFIKIIKQLFLTPHPPSGLFLTINTHKESISSI